jgi:NADH-quinone oxidoreductase subunit L
MPKTALTFCVGAAALAGVPFFSGFYSKEEILAGAWTTQRILWGFGVVGAVMTAFYMTRQALKVFGQQFRLGEEVKSGLQESPLVMTIPLVLLAVGALSAGWMGHVFHNFLAPLFTGHGTAHSGAGGSGHGHILPLFIAVGASLIGVGWGVVLYLQASERPSKLAAALGPLYRLLLHKFYVDEMYERFITSKGHALSRFLAQACDLQIIDGLVNGVARVMAMVGEVWRRGQTGYVRNYALTMVVGAVVILLYFMTR